MAGNEKLYPLSTNYQSGQFASLTSGNPENIYWNTTWVEWHNRSNSTTQIRIPVDFTKYYQITFKLWCNSYYAYSNMQKVTCGNYSWGNSTSYRDWNANGQKTITLTKANTGLTTGYCTITLTRASGNTGYVQARLYDVYGYYYNVLANVVPSGCGTVSGQGEYGLGTSCTLEATAITGYEFKEWTDENDLPVSTSNPYTFAVSGDLTLNANFELAYDVTLIYDSDLGSASWSVLSGTTISLVATPNVDAQFVGWYVNSIKISDSLNDTYLLLGDTTIEARFEPIYVVSASVDGNGAIQYTRGTDQNDITVSVIPDANYHFTKYTIDGVDNTATPLQLHLTADTTIVAYFEEDDKYHISCPTNINNISVYISANDVYSGTSVTLWARPFPDYNFVRWGDGETTNPRQITVTENVTLTAEYQRVTDTNGIYQYRCFIKDQLNLTDPPKSFMVVDTFDVNVDLLTNATSSITVMEIPSNVNEGDVLVLYDPKGQFLYNGVITSIEDKTINCSQMQSFYKGSWVYQTSSETYLEQEIATVLELYAQGKQKGSSYTDPLVAQRLGGITVDYVGSITSHLPTRWSGSGSQYEVLDMEDFIYELYQRYSIVFDFEINFSGTNYVHIKVPTFSKVSVGNNMFAIKDMSPVTEIEETNRLIVYGTNNTYRKTYVATKSGIVEEPSSTANRFNITNTEIVFSDDTLADLVSANLPSTMYNHKLTFTLIIKNFIYEFGDFNLGGEMDVYYNDDYYGTVLTGYEITKESNQNITEAKFTCGKVRVALTKMLTMGVV